MRNIKDGMDTMRLIVTAQRLKITPVTNKPLPEKLRELDEMVSDMQKSDKVYEYCNDIGDE